MPDIDIKSIEKKWLEYWEKEKIYSFDPLSNKKIYSIDTPPPTVSGKMHIGHAFSYAQQDFIARFKRMSGFNVFYPFGTDDNGLPTERLIEKLKNVKSKSMSRVDFISLCLKTLKEITPDFIQDWKNLGISCDYAMYYSTINPISQKISQLSFLQLYKKGLIYKEGFPTLFCPECQTPIAQAELEDKEKETFLTTIKFMSNNTVLPIATTRPELLAACAAVFVNPEDKRYSHLIKKKASVPLFDYEVPIIADPSAQLDKGTGVLMVCSYGDKYDVEAIKKHKLQQKVVLTKQGTLNIEKYSGLKIKDARKVILKDLKDANLIIEQKQIKHNVNVHDKCGTEIEFLPTEQWFIKILDKKKELIAQGRKITWHPKHMQKRYENWISGLEWDWSISRERHFGIPIPAWHCPKCKDTILADESDLPIDPIQIKKQCKKCKSFADPEEKVLDTWATSSLTPQIASYLVNNKIKIPYSLRPQAHDIIRTWAFYTIVKALYHENSIPWKEITISGFVTLGGEKMSKSKGNVISPQEILQTYGADALRYWAASSKLGEDLDYQEKDLVTGKRFITKILNVANFIFPNIKYQEKMPKLQETDHLFLTQINSLIKSATSVFQDYNYSKAKLETDQFFWKIFADNYLEIIKHRIYNGKEQEKASASYTLYQSFLTIIKLIAPFTPYITEDIYQTHFAKHEKDKSIHLSEWPSQFKIKSSKEDEIIWSKMLEIITLVRQKKSEAKKSMKSEIHLFLTKEDQALLKPVLNDLKAVCNAKEIKEGDFNVQVL
ncbi:valine--tRNA ligase [Candidatus Pacearchaeota archaeon]|nr:valine--tRNA ligase [Candidatus Pacearchaeota archaeon]